jgi:hypothetical protein
LGFKVAKVEPDNYSDLIKKLNKYIKKSWIIEIENDNILYYILCFKLYWNYSINNIIVETKLSND